MERKAANTSTIAIAVAAIIAVALLALALMTSETLFGRGNAAVSLLPELVSGIG